MAGIGKEGTLSAYNSAGGNSPSGTTMRGGLSGNKFAPFAKTLRKNTFRAKELMLARLGGKSHDRTEDALFDQYVQNIQRQHVLAQRFGKELRHYITCVKALSNATKILNIVMCEAAENEHSDCKTSQFTTSTHNLEVLWNEYCDALTSNILPALQIYLDQFADIEKRINKRNRKLLDFDGARHEMIAAENAFTISSKKTAQIEAKVLKAEEFLTQSKFAFEEINNELHRRLPRIRDSRMLFYTKTIYDLQEIERRFHYQMNEQQLQTMPLLRLLLEEAETGQFKAAEKQQIVTTHQHLDTKARIKKRQTEIRAVPLTLSTVVLESDDMQMAAASSSSTSGSGNAAVINEIVNCSDDDSDNSNDFRNERIDSVKEDESDTDVSITDVSHGMSKTNKDVVDTHSPKSRTGAAARLGNAILAKANVLLQNVKNDSMPTADTLPGDNYTSGNAGGDYMVKQTSGNADHEVQQVPDDIVEFRSIRKLDDDGSPITLVATPGAKVTTTNGAKNGICDDEKSECEQRTFSVRSASQHGEFQQATSRLGKPLADPNLKEAVYTRRTITTVEHNSAADVPRLSSASQPLLTSEKPTEFNSIGVVTHTKGFGSGLDSVNDISGTQLENRKILYRSRATHAYRGEDADELSFDAGELIYVTEYDTPDDQDVGWQMGIRVRTGETGVFPENFTSVIIGSQLQDKV